MLTTVYQQDLAALANQRVWSVLGLRGDAVTGDDVRWRVNDQRPPTRDGGTLQHRELASGITANVNAMARVGLLFLRKGDWNGTRVLSEDFVTRVRTPLPENAGPAGGAAPRGVRSIPNAQTDYGVLWWTNKSKTMPNVPEDAFWAWGLGEELIVVIPSLDLVIVRNGGQATASGAGRTWNDRDWDGDVDVLGAVPGSDRRGDDTVKATPMQTVRRGASAPRLFYSRSDLQAVLLRLQRVRHCFDRPRALRLRDTDCARARTSACGRSIRSR